ncbi:MAG: site-2 protease family protein [Phycisphaerales bacterium]|nr:site-2 protease family protein [Phycisphaerales bacterium]
MLSTAFDLLLVVVGFGLIIVIHELGHFLAARWAGIRVLAFAVGFGPALFSFRKGLGWRTGSSEPEILAMQNAALGDAGGRREQARSMLSRVSPTEYRFNLLPFGGYVKMLGQDDIRPEAVSDAPDGYQSCVPWKRMVVISAGVIFNIISAAALFVLVFLIGLRTEPAKIGWVAPGSPAAFAACDDTAQPPGLAPGDVITSINGRTPNSFNDLILATAMGQRGTPLRVSVDRPGVPGPLNFSIIPEESRFTGLLEIGVEPARTARVVTSRKLAEREAIATQLGAIGLVGVEPGMRLSRAGAHANIQSASDYLDALNASDGTPIPLTFTGDDARTTTVNITPIAQLQIDAVESGPNTRATIEHLLGLTPVMSVREASERAQAQGLVAGDVFLRIGETPFPNIVEGMAAIKAAAGKTLRVVVARPTPDAGPETIELPSVSVGSDGRIGFTVGDTAADAALLAAPPAEIITSGGTRTPPPAASLDNLAGWRVTRVNDTSVETFTHLRAALRAATAAARQTNTPATLTLTLSREGEADRTQEWTLAPASVAQLHALGWSSRLGPGLFEPEQILLKADGPMHALSMGISETRRVMLMTYVTFLRLFQGTVKVEHLKGPVGIAHLGTLVAGKGFIWLLFFMGLISVNLAVINFLPLPIVDGGQFLFILYEQVRGRPVPVSLQNAATLAGLALIGVMFLVVTFNDIRNLIAP